MNPFSSPLSSPRRTLAIAPGTRHLGFAVLEDGDLVRFGVRSFPASHSIRATQSAILAYLKELHLTYQPNTLAIEDVFYAQAKLSRLPRLIATMKEWARERGIRVASFPPPVIKNALCGEKTTRAALADAMTRRYRFLYRFAKSPKNHSYSQQMFDAVALGSYVEDSRIRKARASSPISPFSNL